MAHLSELLRRLSKVGKPADAVEEVSRHNDRIEKEHIESLPQQADNVAAAAATDKQTSPAETAETAGLSPGSISDILSRFNAGKETIRDAAKPGSLDTPGSSEQSQLPELEAGDKPEAAQEKAQETPEIVDPDKNRKQFVSDAERHIVLSKTHFQGWKRSRFTDSSPRALLSEDITSISLLSERYQFDSVIASSRLSGKLINILAEENIHPNQETADTIERAVDEFDRLAVAIEKDADEAEQEFNADVIKAVEERVNMPLEQLGRPLDFVLMGRGIVASDSLFKHDDSPIVVDDFKITSPRRTVDANLSEAVDSDSSDEYDICFDNPNDLDKTILDTFLEEAQDIIKTNQRSLANWKKNPGNMAEVQKLQRGMHTLKGGARMAGLSVLGDLSHYVETLLDGLARGTVSDKNKARLLLEEANTMSATMVQLANYRKIIYESPDYLQRLDTFLHDQTGKSLDYSRVGKDDAQATDDGKEKKGVIIKKKGYSVRLNSKLVDKMSSLVGEDIVTRTRLERKMSEHNYQLDELSRTVTRIREQLRQLGNKTEAQILFGHNVSSDSPETLHDGFDPLELDYFSEIQQLSRQLAESMDDLYSIRGNLSDCVERTRQSLLYQTKIHQALQDTILSTSVVRFDSIYARMDTLVKQVSKDLHKVAKLEIEGGEVGVERNVLETLIPAFEHAVRNAVAHGIETLQERKKIGKGIIGRVRLSAHRRGSEIWFAIADDGHGIDLATIKKKAKRLGMLDEKYANSKGYLLRLLFEPGFSTADNPTQIYGRGIGLDVLREVVRTRHGSIEVDTEPGQGLTIGMRLPFTVSVADVLPVRIGQYTYAIPIVSIEGIARIPHEVYQLFMHGEKTHYLYGQYTYKFESLVDFLDPYAKKVLSPRGGVPALLVKVGYKRIIFEVGEIGNSQEVLIKSVNRQFTALPGIIGATVLDDGHPVPVLEASTLGRYFLDYQQSGHTMEDYTAEGRVIEVEKETTILVVDDSITIRKVSAKLLSKYNAEVRTAKDGLEAIDILDDWRPDVILLDIEMPHMDGFELATYIRNSKEYGDIPIIMITSRAGEKHKERAKVIGVNNYLGKPYTEEVLIATISKTLNKKIEK
ncbi:MAG: hypothetical protein CR975_03090 [Gammaproteobacteria bacterium]|nr:MAG: hypothetical protein CR975_03090 [Gammaproteobacteria bacterium]